MVDDMINIAKTWLNRFKPDNVKTKVYDKVYLSAAWSSG